jgi:2-oxoisovalerate dehydrogenase E1 component
MSKATRGAVSVDLYAKSMLIRSVEQRLLKLFAEGKLFGTVHTCIGQEWTGVAIAECLKDGDLIFSNHRCHGHYLARTGDVEGLIAEIMGKQSGMCGGRGGSQHICSQGFFSNGIQGGITPVAGGLAFSQKLQASDNITVVFVGDGTLGEGVVYESLNIASKWELPLLVVLENNYYAQSTPQQQTLAGDICSRAMAFGIKTIQANTWNPEDLLSATADSVAFVREQCRPLFLQIDTYRLMAHSKSDDDRDRAEVERYWAKDPITRFIEENLEEAATIQSTINDRIEVAVALAESAHYTGLADGDEDAADLHVPQWSPTRHESTDRCVNLIHASLQRNMQKHERIILLGEDIEGPYGGAFKVTKNLSLEFPGRVRNTPIGEASLVGIGNGLALSGFLPVCEIMFGDFLALAADQLLNHSSKFHYMYNRQVKVPVIVRTPMGGKRGYGPTHSQSIEKHFLGLPGTLMLALHHRYDPGLVYDTLFSTIDRPTLVIENKLLYGVHLSNKVPEGFALEHSDERFPTTRIRPEGDPNVTILCYGGMLPDVEKAVDELFEEYEVICEVVCPTQLYPLNPLPVIESVQKSGRLVTVEEGLSFSAFGAEVAAEIVERSPGILKNFCRLSSPRHPIPSCGPLEKTLLPGVSSIVTAVLEVVRGGDASCHSA